MQQLGLFAVEPTTDSYRPKRDCRRQQSKASTSAGQGERPPETYRPEDVERVVSEVCSDCAEDIAARNRALLRLLWRSGLRISEALALTPNDVDLDEGIVIVQKPAKSHHPRTVTLSDLDVTDDLRHWLNVRAAMTSDDEAPLFCTRRGTRVDASDLRHRFGRARARLGRRIHSHGLRHTHTAELYEAGVCLTEIQAQLGHKSLSTTCVYLGSIGATKPTTVRDARSSQC